MQITVVQPPELEPGDLAADKLQQTIDSLTSEATATTIPWKRGVTLEKLGSVYFFTGQQDKAIETLNQALEAHGDSNSPMVTRIHIALGLAYRSIGRADQAIATWEKGIGLLLARAIEAIDDEGTSIADQTKPDLETLRADTGLFPRIKRLCQSDLNFAILRNNMGVVHYERGDLKRSRQMLEEAIEFSPTTVHYDHPVGNLDTVI